MVGQPLFIESGAWWILTNLDCCWSLYRLNLPSEIVPATFKKVQRATPAGRPQQSTGAYRAPRGDGGGDREGYRKKESGADGGFRPRFAGIGRGAPTGDAPAAGSW
jgi:small subunit ribosomal protein S10e